jgi:hypothetical protein
LRCDELELRAFAAAQAFVNGAKKRPTDATSAIEREGVSREPEPARSLYDLKMRDRIEGRMMMKGEPSGPRAGIMKAPLSSFFVSV